MVRALRDPDGANLDRVQVIKGWIDGEGDRPGQLSADNERLLGTLHELLLLAQPRPEPPRGTFGESLLELVGMGDVGLGDGVLGADVAAAATVPAAGAGGL